MAKAAAVETIAGNDSFSVKTLLGFWSDSLASMILVQSTAVFEHLVSYFIVVVLVIARHSTLHFPHACT